MNVKTFRIVLRKLVIVSSVYFLGIIFIITIGHNFNRIVELIPFILQNEPQMENSTNMDFMKFLDPPSMLPYNLKKSKKTNGQQSNQVERMEVINLTEIFFPYKIIQGLYPPGQGLKKGYFVEAGALDGELLSNTLYLELELGWSGLLVEPFLRSYTKLRKKNRKAWTCNCCLGIEQYPYEAHIASRIERPRHTYFDATPKEFKHGSNFIVGSKFADLVAEDTIDLEYETIQCLPIKDLLKELKVQKIDLFSLDVEGSEIGVLESFPWEDVVVDVWIIEHFNFKYKQFKILDQEFISWFKRKGYNLYDSNADSGDYIFILKNSSLATSNIDLLK